MVHHLAQIYVNHLRYISDQHLDYITVKEMDDWMVGGGVAGEGGLSLLKTVNI